MALIYSILCLAEYKDIQVNLNIKNYIFIFLNCKSFLQDRAREEVNRVWQKADEIIGVAEIQKLTYVERIIKESLRLFPSVPIVARNVSEDLQLSKSLI